MRNADFDPQSFRAVIVRIRTPKIASLVFESGRAVITGARSEEDCRLAARKVTRLVQKTVHPEAVIREFKVSLPSTCSPDNNSVLIPPYWITGAEHSVVVRSGLCSGSGASDGRSCDVRHIRA